MKANIFLFTLVLAALFFSTCKKTEDTPGKLDPDGDCFTALIDGQSFDSNNVIGTDVGNLLNISATLGVANFQSFGINLTNTNVGTFDISPQGGADVVAEYSEGPINAQVLYVGISGSLTIQEHDQNAKKIKGIFNFEGDDTMGDTISITDGFFDVKYQ